ncbi:MAG TPA: peptidoglycan DD-metalloendopeptidase family protein [Sphingomicrobium sp.]|nr:peptidoglycan DD-metalloendopeptidase family protein [Sphingomicrobium sp.]
MLRLPAFRRRGRPPMSDWQTGRPRRFAVIRRSLRPIRFELHPFAAAGAALVLIAMLGWSGATTTYALFRDEFLMQILSHSAALERASRAEIARLKDDLERANSRLLVERENFISKLEVLSRRQADVERRQETLSNLAAQAGGETATEEVSGELRLGEDEALRESRAPDSRSTASHLAARYDALEHRQKEVIAGLRTRLDGARENLSEAYAALGLTPAGAPVKAGLGGLYLPFGFGRADPLSRDLHDLEDSAAEVARLRGGLDRVPVRSPAPDAAFTSGFGTRLDPFLGKPAFHSGIDFEAAPGSPARATASGTVLSAGWNGNYGLMVELEHDHGYTTRYAHLSSIAVAAGQDVKTGDVVGYTGSTGRSTGPHLHYETRLNNRPLDPRRFLKAGEKLD